MNSIIKDGIKVVAEIAQSYEGEINILKRLVEKLQKTKVNGIMFQVVYADEIALPENNNYNFFKSLEFSGDQWDEIISMIHEDNKIAVGECFGINSAKMLFELKIDALKIHPADLANIPFLHFVSTLHIPLLVGIGAAHENEIEIALKELKNENSADIILMHGYQLCPTKIEDTHLMKITALAKRFGLPVGYSDHIAGSVDNDFAIKNLPADILPLLSIATGAKVIEKHVMLDRSKAWEDNESALTPEELDEFITMLHTFYPSLGSEDTSLNNAESEYRQSSRKHIVSSKFLEEGHSITVDDISFKRIANPQIGIVNSEEVLGKEVLRSIKENEPITSNDLRG